MSADYKKILIPMVATIRDAVKTINDCGFEIALVIDEERSLLGTITDGDIRRALLDGMSMDTPAEKIMNREPLVAAPETDPGELLKKMNEAVLRQIPLLDDDGRVAGLAHIRDLTPPMETRENSVVLMAGGMTPIDRIVRSVTESMDACQKAFDALNKTEQSQVRLTTFEATATNPENELRSISDWLGTEPHPDIAEVMARERVPRDLPLSDRQKKLALFEQETSPSLFDRLLSASRIYEKQWNLEPVES